MTQKIFETDGARVTAYLDGPHWSGAPTATLGRFSCKTPEAGAAVLQQALGSIAQSGLRHVIGPMEGDTWHSYRYVAESDGSAPFLMEPPDKPMELRALREAGFAPISEYFSARVGLATMDLTPPPATDAFAIEPWDGENPEALFAQVFALSVEAFAQNAFYKPITRADFLAMYMPMVPVLKRELIFFARRPDDTLAGFLFGVPNYAEGPSPSNAILKTYASLEKGAGRHLSRAFHSAAHGAGYTAAIHALIHDDNLSALRSSVEGAEVFRRYTLLGRVLDG